MSIPNLTHGSKTTGGAAVAAPDPAPSAACAAWNIAHGLVWNAARFPDKVALRDSGGGRWTYRDLNRRINRLAHALDARGLRAGDTILMLVGDRMEHLELLFAGAKLGIVTAALDHRWTRDEIALAVARFRPRAVVYEAEMAADAPVLDGPRLCLETDYEALITQGAETEALLPVVPSTLFTIGSTSGTSGMPKGIALTHGNMLARMWIYGFDLGFGPHDLWLSNTPLAHGGGRAFAMATLILGGSVLLDHGFDAERTMRLIARERVTACFMVPTMFRRILALPGLETIDTAGLRCLISSGAPLAPETHAGILEHLTGNFYQFYSSTESGGIALLPPWFQDSKRDTVGIGVFGKELRLAEDGEILSRGPAVTPGY